ncbi:hypothetical protein ACO0K9_06070 [Undibacterium sp. Ji50W]|uniref:hypothetical protein n=1 Tax=Undibacterium sp. Ji50W TaxID=3413041 RepID=UPI003BF1D591
MKLQRFFTPLLCLTTATMLSACGGGGSSTPANSANPGNGGTTGVPATSSVALFVGSMGGPGNIDGTGVNARFYSLSGIALDATGTLYVSDVNRLRKISQAGVVTTFAGGEAGNVDGVGSTVRFNGLQNPVVDAAGNMYALDASNYTIRKLSPAGVSSTLAGKPGVAARTDGLGAAAGFTSLNGLTIDTAGNLYVADDQTIRKITAAGQVTTIAGQFSVTGADDGPGISARFNRPMGLAADNAGNVYVADRNNYAIRKITPAGVVSTIAGRAGSFGSTDDAGSAARFNCPQGLAVDAAANIYVADPCNATIRKVTPFGVVSTVAGSAGQQGIVDGAGSSARFSWPLAIASDGAGNLYVADSNNSNVRKITSGGVVTTLAGSGGIAGPVDGIGSSANFWVPGNLTADSSGNLYVADRVPGAATLRKVNPAMAVTTVFDVKAGFGTIGGLTTDTTGNVYVADNLGTVSKITPAGSISQLAGMPYQFGLVNDTGTNARFNSPNGIVTASNGDILIADIANQVIRKMTANGVVSTFAAVPLSPAFYPMDSIPPRQFPRLSNGMAIDASGNVYVADGGNHVIFKISSAGVSSIFAGATGQKGSADGSGAAARFNGPQGITIDTKGNLYVADTDNHTVRKITPAGLVSTLMGVAGQEGFVAGTLPGFLSKPQAVVFSGDALYVTTYHGVVVARNF